MAPDLNLDLGSSSGNANIGTDLHKQVPATWSCGGNGAYECLPGDTD